MRVEVLTDPEMALRGQRILRAMVDAAPIEVRERRTYVGDCHLLMVYGTGHPVRRPWWQKHLKRGGRCIGWDLGYWKHQEDGTCRMRVTLDQDHPQRWLREEPASRWEAEGIHLRSDFNPAGPVVIVGLGAKALQVHGYARLQWERQALQRVRAARPGARVLMRPKRRGDPSLPGLPVVHGDIADAIRGASLVVCRHSNVAIDACIAGIPVVCEDGAAAALYGSDIGKPVMPTEEQRRAFLQNLAWWQWKPEEASQAWNYLLKRLSA